MRTSVEAGGHDSVRVAIDPPRHSHSGGHSDHLRRISTTIKLLRSIMDDTSEASSSHAKRDALGRALLTALHAAEGGGGRARRKDNLWAAPACSFSCDFWDAFRL